MNRKILISIFIMLSLLITISSVVMAEEDLLLDSVDFGSAGTEDGHNLEGWGRSATDQTGGNYGGIGPGGCRLVWDDADDEPDAVFTLSSSGGIAETLVLVHLDGMTDDGLDIEVKDSQGTWLPVGSYADTDADEIWVTSTFDLRDLNFDTGEILEFRITATGEKWQYFDQWGQLCIDKAELFGTEKPEEPEEPEPGEFCDIQFKPPANLLNHPVNVNATLPIKFWMSDCYGNPLRGGENPTLVVQYKGEENGEGDSAETEPEWNDVKSLDLKRGTGGYQFIALFRPEKVGLYRAVVSFGEDETWTQEFEVVAHGNGNGKSESKQKVTGKDKPKSEDKVTGQDKEKPGKPDPEEKEKKPKGKPEDKPGKAPKKP